MFQARNTRQLTIQKKELRAVCAAPFFLGYLCRSSFGSMPGGAMLAAAFGAMPGRRAELRLSVYGSDHASFRPRSSRHWLGSFPPSTAPPDTTSQLAGPTRGQSPFQRVSLSGPSLGSGCRSRPSRLIARLPGRFCRGRNSDAPAQAVTTKRAPPGGAVFDLDRSDNQV